jgi:hypothetical protein
VRGVHEDAVDQALGYLERHALAVRRGAGGEDRVGAEGLVAAASPTRRLGRATPSSTRTCWWPTRRRQGGPGPEILASYPRSKLAARCRLGRSGRGDRAQREPAPTGVVGARHPRRAADGASQRALATYERGQRGLTRYAPPSTTLKGIRSWAADGTVCVKNVGRAPWSRP